MKAFTKEEMRRVLEHNQAKCLDSEEDREALLDSMFDARARPGTRTSLHEEVLGPGLAVRYRADEFVGFIFLNPDDHPTFVPASELDPGWRQKLLKAIR
jgi:hypothetical protein